MAEKHVKIVAPFSTEIVAPFSVDKYNRQRAAAAEAARIAELQEKWAEAQRIADENGLNITTNMDGWSLEQKIAYFNEVIRICKQLESRDISVEDAQKEVNDIIEKIGSEGIAKAFKGIVFIIDGVTFGVPASMADLAKVEIVGIPAKIIGGLLAFGILLSIVDAIEYFKQTGDILGAVVRVVLDSLILAILYYGMPLLVNIANIALPGLGPIIAITAGIVFSLWWSFLGGQELVANYISDQIRKYNSFILIP